MYFTNVCVVVHETALEELARLPEIKCICGFRVFHKETTWSCKKRKSDLNSIFFVTMLSL